MAYARGREDGRSQGVAESGVASVIILRASSTFSWVREGMAETFVVPRPQTLLSGFRVLAGLDGRSVSLISFCIFTFDLLPDCHFSFLSCFFLCLQRVVVESDSLQALFDAWSSCYHFIHHQLAMPSLPEQPTTQFAPSLPASPSLSSPTQVPTSEAHPIGTQLTLSPPGTSDIPEGSSPKRPRFDPPHL